jgi:hypothetical protein
MNIETKAPTIAEMVNRFLGWKLPKDFAPDGGISFTPSPHPLGWPIGTHLLTADQARAMFEYCLAASTIQPTDAQEFRDKLFDAVRQFKYTTARQTNEIVEELLLLLVAPPTSKESK